MRSSFALLPSAGSRTNQSLASVPFLAILFLGLVGSFGSWHLSKVAVAQGTDGGVSASDEPIHTQRYGFLKINRSKPDHPAPYVLTDPWGEVKYFVTAPKSMDVTPYLNHHVAIRGKAYQRKHRFEAEEIRTTDEKSASDKGSEKVAAARPTSARRAEGDLASDAPVKEVTAAATAATRASSPRSAASQAIRRRSAEIAVADHQEPIPAPQGRLIMPGEAGPELGDPATVFDMEEGPYADEVFSDEFAEDGMVGDMGEAWGGPWGGYGRPNRFWVRTEYLLWQSEGMRAPALVSTSPAGTARDLAGVLGQPGTTVLFGGDHLDHDAHSGVRVKAGMWCNPGRTCGIEGEYWGLSEVASSYTATSTGNPILARPFYDAVNGRETSELVAFPAVLQGTVSASAVTDLQSAGARFVWCCCCQSCNDCDPCGGTFPSSRRIDWLLGYRYLQLDDVLSVREDLVSLEAANPGTFVVQDTFDTRNQFNGGEFGVQYTLRRAVWSLEFLSKLALGNNHQRVTINGTTDITQAGQTQRFTGGLLGQRTNIGVYERDQFSIVPEVGLTLGCQLTPRLKGTVGYTFIYWANVVRPGDQIDRDINPNLLPPENPIQTTHLRPEFVFRDTDIWVHGLNAGLELRW